MMFLLIVMLSYSYLLGGMEQKQNVFFSLSHVWQDRVNAVARNLPREIAESAPEILDACIQARRTVWADRVAAALAKGHDLGALEVEMHNAATVQHGNRRSKA